MAEPYDYFVISTYDEFSAERDLATLYMLRGVVHASVSGECCVIVVLEEQVREDAAEALERLVMALPFVDDIVERGRRNPFKGEQFGYELTNAAVDAIEAMRPDAEKILKNADYAAKIRVWKAVLDAAYDLKKAFRS